MSTDYNVAMTFILNDNNNNNNKSVLVTAPTVTQNSADRFQFSQLFRLVVTTTTADGCGCSRRSIKETVNESTNILLAVFDVFVTIARERKGPIPLQERPVIWHYELLVVLAQCVTKFRIGDRKCLLDTMDVFHFTIETLQKMSRNYK